MAQRPRSGGGPEEGTPEYDWLYGSGSGAPGGPGRPEPDPTRVMPTQPRGGAGAPYAPPPPPRGPAAPTPAREPRRPARGRRRRPPVLRILLLLLVLWLVFLVVTPFLAWREVSEVDAAPDGERPPEQPGTTYLVVGSDSREGLTPEQRRELTTGNAGGRRTDTIMLLHTGDGPNVLMSIPRDSIVEVPGNGTTKVNAAYAFGGPQLLVRTIEQNTGIRVDHYVEVGFGGFVGVVDAVGGIEICPEQAIQDPQAGLKVEAGCQEADGVTALGYARSRKTYRELGDVQRAQAQREVVSGVAGKAVSPRSVLDPFRYWALTHAAAESVRVSEGTGPFRMGLFALAMTRVDGEAGLTCGVPIADLAVNWDSERAPRMFRYLAEDDTASIPDRLCTPSGLPPR
ncbi:LCP family protein [Nocardioides perillae]|uniref:LCP family protein required for cell wall assembly n=1 Tax=Nocardioides perillae TaxID=1119534 RepID=A0A7Y9ULL2_9ACTN|nr:LCP family protein [Nocardioides perillae]NYG55182.1 LCP family protein required for cell wall assembly [Nocardioides perillae]